MADRILKPDSGNQLILQDEGGSASLTIDTSGNTILAGTANNLGTISSATFPSGHILQCVQQVLSTFAQTNSTSYTATGLTQAITPSATSNKILIIVSANLGTNTGSAQTISMDLTAGGSSIRVFETVLAASSAISGQISFTYLHSPSSTSSVTYAVDYKCSSGGSNYIRINNYVGSSGDSASSITLMEVKG